MNAHEVCSERNRNISCHLWPQAQFLTRWNSSMQFMGFISYFQAFHRKKVAEMIRVAWNSMSNGCISPVLCVFGEDMSAAPAFEKYTEKQLFLAKVFQRRGLEKWRKDPWQIYWLEWRQIILQPLARVFLIKEVLLNESECLAWTLNSKSTTYQIIFLQVIIHIIGDILGNCSTTKGCSCISIRVRPHVAISLFVFVFELLIAL